MEKLMILRGCPGSGKTTYAKYLAENAWQDGYMSVIICSADDYFIRPDGVYDFNAKMLKNAHQWCKDRVEKAMSEEGLGNGWPGEYDLIVVDNTHTRHWEYQAYLDLAKKYEYPVEIKVIGEFTEEKILEYANRNSHGVPLETVRKMAERFDH